MDILRGFRIASIVLAFWQEFMIEHTKAIPSTSFDISSCYILVAFYIILFADTIQ